MKNLSDLLHIYNIEIEITEHDYKSYKGILKDYLGRSLPIEGEYTAFASEEDEGEIDYLSVFSAVSGTKYTGKIQDLVEEELMSLMDWHSIWHEQMRDAAEYRRDMAEDR